MKTDKKKVSRHEKHQFYEKNKEAIIADLLSMGRTATSKKWDIPTSSLFVLQTRWLSAEQIAIVDRITVGLPAQDEGSYLHLLERIGNIERQLFGLSYEEARPIYDSVKEVLRNLEHKQGLYIKYYEENQKFIMNLECVLGIHIPEFSEFKRVDV